MALVAVATGGEWREGVDESIGASHGEDLAHTPTFVAESHQNEFLAPGEHTVTAIVSVAAEGEALPRDAPETVEVILLDCSASMGHPWDKVVAARAATRAAVESLRDGVWFAVVRGDEAAAVAYPPKVGLVQASAATKREAANAIGSLQPVGGTAIGRWLSLARDLMMLRPNAIHHAILLTDGKDENETKDELDAALLGCEGQFQCDCRGIGTDWAVSELRTIAVALLGTLDIIADPADMEDDFRSITAAAMARQVEAVLQVWAPQRANVTFLRQVSPTIGDLTSRGRPVGPFSTEYPIGAWAAERREYHLELEVQPGPVGVEMLAARVSVVVRNRALAKTAVKAVWTNDLALSAPISEEVAHYSGQAELAQAIQEGLKARTKGDKVTATARLGRAVQLAAQGGNDATTRLLARVVEVDDAATGTVRLKSYVEVADEMALDTRSTKTTRLSR